MKDSIVKFYKEQSGSILKYYLKVKEKQGMEDIHQLRVSIKNLRVILSIIELASNGEFSKKNHYQLVARLFQKAGRVRESQLNIQLLKQMGFKCSKKFLKHQRIRQTEHIEHLLIEIQKIKLKKFRRLNKAILAKVKDMPEKVFEKTISKYINKSLKKIKKIRDKIKGDSGLHSIRIHLKKIGEVLEMLSSVKDAKKMKALQVEIKSVRRELGIWHDHIVLSSSIQVYIKQGKKHKSAVKKVYNRIKKKNHKRRKKINSKLQVFPIDELLMVDWRISKREGLEI